MSDFSLNPDSNPGSLAAQTSAFSPQGRQAKLRPDPTLLLHLSYTPCPLNPPPSASRLPLRHDADRHQVPRQTVKIFKESIAHLSYASGVEQLGPLLGTSGYGRPGLSKVQ